MILITVKGIAALTAVAMLATFSTQSMATGLATQGQTALSEAHKFRVEGKFGDMTNAVRDALRASANDPAIAKNASKLLRAAALESRRPLPMDWTVPDGMSNVKLTQSRRERANGSVGWKLRIQADLVAAGVVQQLQIVHYPNRIILDKQAGIGEWIEGNWQGQPFFTLTSGSEATSFPEGLYLLNITMTSGTSVLGWFVLSDLEADSSPIVTSPRSGEVLNSASPEVTWENWYSSHYRTDERRSAFLGIRAVNAQGEWTDAWETFWSNDIPTSARVGDGGNGVPSLVNGDYVAVLNIREAYRFGDIRMRREGSRLVPFKVLVE